MKGPESIETVIVGGGQAGLAVGYHLKQRGRPFVVLDSGDRVGDAWRKRWPSLRLYTPASLDGLPGMPFPARGETFPSTNDMADYLEAYAERFELPVRTSVEVDGVERLGAGYRVTAGDVCFEAENVVVATGVFQHERPVIPEFAAELDPAIVQLHSADYRGPEQLQEGAVLVVGAAHSGGDIAYEVARAGHPTVLSGRDTGQLPFAIEGRLARRLFPVIRLLWTRVLSVSTPMGRRAKAAMRSHGGPLLRVRRADLEAAGVERVHERTASVEDGRPALAGGRVLDVANVIWCTGFRNDYGWIRFPLPLDADGFPEQERGAVASVPGIFFVGLPFLHSFASMLIVGAAIDGKRVADAIAARAKGEARDERVEAVAERAVA